MLQINTAPFFNTQHFAQVAVLGGVTVHGIFDDAYAVGDVGELGMATSQPTLLLSSSQVPANVRGMTLQVDGQHFSVEDVQPDGTGMTLLLLEVLHA